MKRDDMRASRGARTDESEEGAVPVSSSDEIRVHAVVAGLVQGAGKLGLGGWVRNCYDGSVEVEAQGERGKVARLISALKQGPRYADVERVDVTEIPLQELKPARHGFPSFGVFYER